MERKLAIALGCLAFALYARSVGFAFVNGDDYAFIVENAVMKSHSGFLTLWSDPVNHLYAPLSYSAWFLISLVAGIQASAFHAFSALLHAGATVAVFFAVLHTLRVRPRTAETAGTSESSAMLRRSEFAAGIGALIFACHPVQVETVAWVSEGKDLAFTLFSLLAIDTYLRFAEARDAQESITSAHNDRKRLKAKDSIKLEASSNRATRLFAIGSGLFFLALLAKPAAVVVPAICLAIDTLFLNRAWRKSFGSLGAWFALAAIFAIATAAMQPAAEIAHTTPLWFRPVVALDTLVTYLSHVFFPFHLGADYGRTPEHLYSTGEYHLTLFIGLAILAGAVALAFSARTRWIAGALAVFALGFAPVSGLVSFDYQQYSTVTDHYLYLPMFGIALAVGFLFQKLPLPALGVGAVVAAVLAALSWPLISTWKNNDTLYSATLALNPASFMSYNNLGQAQEAAGNLDAAIETYRQAVRVKPGYLPAENNIGNVLFNQGKNDEALAHYARVISSGEITDPPGHVAARIYNNYAAALAKQGKLREAMTAVQRAVEIDPDFSDARANLATLVGAMHSGNEAK